MKHIVVGMSGGVDSSVAAASLLDQGYKVTGLFMKNWEEDDDEKYCATAEDLADAITVCELLGIELKTINFSYEYWTKVFQLFLAEYKNGRTPNPDILCNKEIKFKEFLQWALYLGADAIATGHYARLEKANGCFTLKKALDKNKDQSYFLHAVDQQALSYTKFPLGEMNKTHTREIAWQLNLPVHSKKDSTGICFIGEQRFSDFLGRFLPAQPGEIRTLDEKIIGQHRGAFYYTLGQRQGLGIGGQGKPWYVVAKDIEKNVVYAVQGHNHPALMKQIVLAEQPHWISSQPPPAPLKCTAKTRYRQQDQECTVSIIDEDSMQVEFTQPQWAVTPGQSIVFYQQEVCLGGGVIKEAFNHPPQN